MSEHDEAHTQLTTRELDRMLAEAHRRGAIEAIEKIRRNIWNLASRKVVVGPLELDEAFTSVTKRYETEEK